MAEAEGVLGRGAKGGGFRGSLSKIIEEILYHGLGFRLYLRG